MITVRTQRILAVTTVALLLTALGSLVWCASTTAGSRTLLALLSRMSNSAFTVHRVEGRLMDHLRLEGVRLKAGAITLESGVLELRWKPLPLLAGTIAIQELKLERLRIRDERPTDSSPPSLAWPRLSSRERLLDILVARLRVSDASYRRLREEPLTLDSCSASLNWRDDKLSVGDLRLVSPAGELRGTLSAGFGSPSLGAALTAVPSRPLAGMERFSLKLEWSRGRGGEQLSGPVSLRGIDTKGETTGIEGKMGLTSNGLNLHDIGLKLPRQKGGLTLAGSILLTAPEPLLDLRLTAAGLDLAPRLNLATDLSGTISFKGSPKCYQGSLNLANRGSAWRPFTLSARYQGTDQGVQLSQLKGRLLDGSLGGGVQLEWRNGILLQGRLEAERLNPARIAPEWKGEANLSATLSLGWPAAAPPRGSFQLSLQRSRLHGRTLEGELSARLAGERLSLEHFLLKGAGFDLRGSGELERRIDLTARVSDLSRLLPGSAGALRAEGWVSRRDHRLRGELTATAQKLAYAGTRVASASIRARGGQGSDSPLYASVSLRGVSRGTYALDRAELNLEGTPGRHRMDVNLRAAESRVRLALAAGYQDGAWKGEISRMEGRDPHGPWEMGQPARFNLGSGRFAITPLLLTAGAAERLELSTDLLLRPLRGKAWLSWNRLNLARLSPWLGELQLSGSSSGTLRLGLLSPERVSLSADATANGRLSASRGSIGIRSARVTVDGGAQGVRAQFQLDTDSNGNLRCQFSSPAPLGLSLPERGKLAASWSELDLALLRPWLPDHLAINGRVNGRVNGSMSGTTLPGRRFQLEGRASLGNGTLHSETGNGELSLASRSSELSWRWQGENLDASLSIATENHGRLKADCRLPLAARLPLSLNPQAPLKGSLTGSVRERGLLASMFPGMLQESQGALNLDLSVGGSWSRPRIGGTVQLGGAGAYLPSAGIRLKDVRLAARLGNDQIQIESFRANSGPGHLEGSGVLTLSGWGVSTYSGSVKGENFQAVFLPELQVRCSPKLSFQGTPKKVSLSGELRLPELRITGATTSTVIAPSSDVIREGKSKPAAKEPPLTLDARIKVLLGDDTLVRVAGLDATLGGGVDLTINGLDRITSSGEIRVVKGRYRTYGVNLEISRGRLFFAGGPLENPGLDFLALRSVGEVKAGVTVTGTLRRPLTTLYSDPSMPDVDILSYIVLGHPLAGSGTESSLMAQVAGALLGSSQASLLLESVKSRLGLSTLEVQEGGVGETMITVGKYLTPKLYVSYGNSLFTGSNLFRLRYDISRRLQLESQTGSVSGVDLYYKLEFK